MRILLFLERFHNYACLNIVISNRIYLIREHFLLIGIIEVIAESKLNGLGNVNNFDLKCCLHSIYMLKIFKLVPFRIRMIFSKWINIILTLSDLILFSAVALIQ